ncbi:MAG: dihydrodipicolinate synthase family protein [Rhizobiaceae bacterium]|nr:MAG: dihydrodipicolinate synthase family protein [Rhizobiaceae bacterium]CAG1015115.1 4-hydroxy-tetrahydrodipicolinate synthase [Rhizobiaceae bacterium]
MKTTLDGIIPVMITPFTPANRIDWQGYETLIEWYIDNGAQALFAVCQSSEMQHLSLDERRDLARFTVERVAGRVPVVASGHVSDTRAGQREELAAVAATGVDGLVLVTNRLAGREEGSEALRARIEDLLAVLPADLPLGLYECPAPFRRLLSDEELAYCAGSGRFTFLKDVSCDLGVVKRRLELVRGTPLGINNANAAIAWPAMQAGARGFCGVMLNFHPDLYRWIQDHGADHPDLAEDLATFLVMAAMCEAFGYPKLAKHYHVRRGTFACDASRAIPFDIHERYWALDEILDRMDHGAERFRRRIADAAASTRATALRQAG